MQSVMSSAQSLSDITDERVVPADYLGVLILLFLFMVLDRLFYTLGLHLGKVAVFIPCQVPSMPFCPGPLHCPALPCPSALPLCPAPLPCPVMSAPALLCLFSPALLPCFALPCPALSCLPGPTSACLSLHPSVNTTDITAYSVLQCLSFQNPLPFTHTLTARLWSEGLHCFAGSVAVGTDGPVLLLHLLPVLEPLQQQQCT